MCIYLLWEIKESLGMSEKETGECWGELQRKILNEIGCVPASQKRTVCLVKMIDPNCEPQVAEAEHENLPHDANGSAANSHF